MDTRNRRLGPWDSLGSIIDAIDGLENTNVKCTWFESVASGLSGTITPPSGGTILLNEWAEGVDVLVSKIDTGVPTFEPVLDDEGAVITGTLDAAGAYTISGTPGDGYPISLIYVYRVTLENLNSVYCLSAAQLEGIDTLSLLGSLGNELTGFPDDYRDQTTIAFDNVTRTFTITPVGDKFSVWVLGREFVYVSAETQVIPDTNGIHWIYFDSDGAIQVVTNPTEDQEENAIKRTALVAYILWDSTNGVQLVFADERHGLTMDGATHFYLHEINGFSYYEGLTAGDVVADGSGNDDVSATFSVTDGTLFDEDIKYETEDSGQVLTNPAQIPIYYIDGVAGTWRKDTADDFPVKSFVGGSGLLAYNSFSSPNYSQTEVGNNNYVLCHIFAVNDISEPVIAIQGQAVYSTIITAREGATTELTGLQLLGAPAQEYTPLYTFIYQTSTAYTNTTKSRIRTTDLGDDYIDWRTTSIGSSGGGGSGDVTGPSSATDNAIVRFDLATGKVIQNSSVTLDDSGNIQFPDATGLLDASGNSAIIIGDSGGLTQYWNNNSITITDEYGLKVGAATGNDPYLWFHTPAFAASIGWINFSSSGSLEIHDDVNGKNLITSSATAVSLYHTGVVKLSTTTAGISITDGTATAATIGLNSDDLIIQNNDPDGKVYIYAEKNGGGSEILFNGDPDGIVYLYYNGDWRLATATSGAQIRGLHSSSMLITIDASGNNDMLGQAWGGTWGFRQNNAAGSAKRLLLGDPDGSVDLYYAGTKKFETTAIGISVEAGTITAGVHDSFVGTFTAYGDGAASSNGGQLVCNTAADHDSTIEWYSFQVVQDDLSIGPSTDTDSLTYYGNDNSWVFTGGDLRIGVNDLVLGRIRVFGDDASGGGVLRVYNGALQDAVEGHYDMYATSTGAFTIVAGTTANEILEYSTSGETTLFYGGSKSIATAAGGVRIYDTSGDDPVLGFYADDDSYLGYIRILDYAMVFNTSDETHMIMNVDGSVDLYYDGTKVFGTVLSAATYGGIKITSANQNSVVYNILYDTGNYRIVNYGTGGGGTIELSSTNSSVSEKSLFLGDPDGAAELYYAGVKNFWTTSEGAETRGGIKFPATQVASTDVNTLDDYEEGTWTPVPADALTGGNTGSASTALGTYTKIGRSVTASCKLLAIDTTGLTSGNVFYIQGLPFASQNTVDVNHYGAVLVARVTFSSQIVAAISDGEQALKFFSIVASNPNVSTKVSDLTDDNANIFVTITYEV